MGLSAVLDTNILIYWLKDQLAENFPPRGLMISVVTEMEMLSFPADAAQQRGINALLARLEIIPLTDAVKSRAIAIRREHRLKLPDAIIAATALAMNAESLSNDAAMAKVPDVRLKRMAIKTTP